MDEPQEREFPIEIHIRNNETGILAVYEKIEKEYFDHTEPNKWAWVDFIWSEGNYSCDCNRSIFWHLAMGLDVPSNPQCGEGGYTIEKIIDLRDGTILYSEDKK